MSLFLLLKFQLGVSAISMWEFLGCGRSLDKPWLVRLTREWSLSKGSWCVCLLIFKWILIFVRTWEKDVLAAPNVNIIQVEGRVTSWLSENSKNKKRKDHRFWNGSELVRNLNRKVAVTPNFESINYIYSPSFLFETLFCFKKTVNEVYTCSQLFNYCYVGKLWWVQSGVVLHLGENRFNVKIIGMWGGWRYKPHR